MVEALKPFLTGNARLLGYGAPTWYETLARFAAANPHGVKISSLDRDVDRQRQLWEQALQKYGSPEAARRWVAPPGRSLHNRGSAADLQYASPAAREWAHANAGNFGLQFPLRNEAWHVEPVGSRQYKTPEAAATAGAPPPGQFDPLGFASGGKNYTMPAAAASAGAPMAQQSPASGLGDALAGLMNQMGKGGSEKPQREAPKAQTLGADLPDFASMLAGLAQPQSLAQPMPFKPLDPGMDPRSLKKTMPYDPGTDGSLADLFRFAV